MVGEVSHSRDLQFASRPDEYNDTLLSEHESHERNAFKDYKFIWCGPSRLSHSVRKNHTIVVSSKRTKTIHDFWLALGSLAYNTIYTILHTTKTSYVLSFFGWTHIHHTKKDFFWLTFAKLKNEINKVKAWLVNNTSMTRCLLSLHHFCVAFLLKQFM